MPLQIWEEKARLDLWISGISCLFVSPAFIFFYVVRLYVMSYVLRYVNVILTLCHYVKCHFNIMSYVLRYVKCYDLCRQNIRINQ